MHIDIKNRIVLLAADVRELADPALFSRAFDSVSEERRQKTSKYRFEKDKMLSLGAELLLRSGLEMLGYDFGKVRILTEKDGKPYLSGADGVFFNLSHSGSYAICALSDRPVGCDIEEISAKSGEKADENLKIAQRFFTKAEYEAICSAEDADQRNLLFYRFWTVKESFIKAIGQGMKLPLNSFDVKFGTPFTSISQNVNEFVYNCSEIGNINGYNIAVCARGEFDLQFISVSIPEMLGGE